MKTKQKGYYCLKTEDGDKWMHFSLNFVFNLKDLTGEDLIAWGKRMDSGDDIDKIGAICDIAYCGMVAHDQEQGNDWDYNLHIVRDWVFNAMRDDDSVAKDLLEALQYSMPKAGKTKGPKKASPKK